MRAVRAGVGDARRRMNAMRCYPCSRYPSTRARTFRIEP